MHHLVTAFNHLQLTSFATNHSYHLAKTVIDSMMAGNFGALIFECIDGRRGGETNEHVVEVPGGALGMLQDVLSCVKADDQESFNIQANVIFETMYKMLGNKFGFHTDDHNQYNNLLCAGCGHCKGALHDPELYLQSPFAVEYVQNILLPRLKQLQIKPTIYSGSHAEKGVVISKKLDVELISISPHTSEQVFTYNEAVHDLFLTKLAENLAIKDLYINIEELLLNKNIRLGVTVEKLAKGLPTFAFE